MSLTHQPLTDLLTGLKTALSVAPVTTLAPGGIHNDVPQAPAWPWIRLWARARPIGTIAADRVWFADVELWIYSRYAGDKEALAIADALIHALEAGITVDGWTVIVTATSDVYPLGTEDIEGLTVKPWVLAVEIQMERSA